MKKLIFGITAIVISFVFFSCPEPGNDGPVIPNNPGQKTVVVFDNTYGICTVLVYDDYRRRDDMDKIAEIPAGQCSDEIECAPSTSTPFYFAYRITLKGVSDFFVDFVPAIGKDQKAVRIDANTKTVIPIPVLDEAVSSEQQVLSPKSYLSIKNNSNYSFQLHRGISMIRPDNFPQSGVVNSGERAPYTINTGRSSDFSLLVGADFKPFPNSPERFEAGNFYRYQYNNDVSLEVQIPINLDNVDIKTYTVNFNSNGGSGTVPVSQTVRVASVITLPAGNGLSKGVEIFGGWCADASGSGAVYSAGTIYTVTGDITLYAKWYPANTTLYTVTFDSAGGSETASQRMVSDAVVIRPPDPIKAGHNFTGWYREPGAQSPYDFTRPVTESFTLSAGWIADRYTVTFNANGAGGTAPAAVTVDYGYSITLPTAGGLSKPDETFRSWNTEDDGTGTAYASGAQFTVTADVTLFAVWSNVPVYEMVFVPDGSFQMGRNLGTGGSDVTPVHNVTLSGFYMGIYEVTQAQYEAVMWTTIEEQQALAGTNTTNYGRGNNYPMYYVNWYETLVFCNRLSVLEGLSPAYRIMGSTNPSDWGSVPTSGNSAWDNVEIVNGSNGYRLPTEAQWEYAAKGGNDNYTYAGSNNPDDVAWYSGNSASTTHTIGTKAPNGLGLYDMSGNVSEWCWDWNGSYPSAAQINPDGASSGTDRIVRGGNWYFFDQYASSVYRFNNNQYLRNNSQGFRLMRPSSYTITFNINGGTGAAPAAQTASPSYITLPDSTGFSKEGYIFDSWNTNADGTGETYSAGSFYTVIGNATLYAKWVYPTITFDINGGSGTTPAAQTVRSGSTITLPDSTGFSKSGYILGAWNVNADGTGTNYSAGSSYTVTDNVTLYARWVYPTITFDINGGTGTTPAALTASLDSSITLPNEEGFSRNGYAFAGWNTNDDSTGINFPAGSSYTVTGNVTLYAKWNPSYTISGGSAYTHIGGVLTITGNGTYTINGTSSATIARIVVASGVNADITLLGVNIDMSDTSDACAFDMTGATVNLTLIGENVLKSGDNRAGIEAPSGATLIITQESNGSLIATGGKYGAGIGGGSRGAGGTITICGGTVTATGGGNSEYHGSGGAGIGGGNGGAGGTITISGGTVTAISGNRFGAGIGGGGYGYYNEGGDGGTINISGGTVTATGGGAGIGGGYNGSGGTITISGGIVTATSDGYSGAGIGGGHDGSGDTITISGGTVTATGCGGSAGIGGGLYGSGGTIIISGGTVTATNGSAHQVNMNGNPTIQGGAGIGGGVFGAGGIITISGGTVTATGANNGAGIGGGSGGAGGTITIINGNAIIFASSIGPALPTGGNLGSAIVFDGNNGNLYGDFTLWCDITIDTARTLTIPAAGTLTIPADVTLTNNGTINNEGTIVRHGTIVGTGTVSGNPVTTP
jgi:uncharacterized repeat protein (TIGR02543 family)